ncbi:MAG: hypothetical protein R3250_01155 [Melioribacteraceae bacterium]|nr:hypothetical protein [Melioribacteraceae bacterium]
MASTRKTIKGRSKKKNAYVSTWLVRVIDTYEKDINKELSKYGKKKCSNAIAGEILAQIIIKEPNLLKKHKSILKKYTRSRK